MNMTCSVCRNEMGTNPSCVCTKGDGPYRTPGETEIDMAFKMKTNYFDAFMDFLTKGFGFTIGFGIAACILYPLGAAILADGKADYCYMQPETWNQTLPNGAKTELIYYSIYQHIPYKSDRMLVRGLDSTEKVRAEAVAFGCPIK